MLDVADQICPQHRQKFEEVSLSRRTVARRIEAVGKDLTSQLKRLVPSFPLFSLALDESTDIDDTAQLLNFVRGISENFEITEELLSMESMKDTTTGEDIFECVKNALRTMELSWQKMVSFTTDGCPSLTGKNVGLLKRLSDRVAEVDCTRELIFLHCIIHQEVLCKKVLDMKHVVDPVVKVVNFIRAVYHASGRLRLRSQWCSVSYSCTLVEYGESSKTCLGPKNANPTIFGDERER